MANTNVGTIVVTGATGNIGGSVVKGLIEKGFVPVVIVREQVANPSWDQAGVHQIAVDMQDRAALREAFNGAEKVFSMTPLVENIIELANNITAAAKQAGVKHIVRSSALGAKLDAPITMGKWHGKIEQAIEDSGVDYTIVQPSSFFQNYFAFAETIKSENAFYAPMGDGRVAMIDARDIAAVAVAALTEDGHVGKKYQVTGGEALSNDEIAQTLSDVLGRSTHYIDVPEDKARAQMLQTGMKLKIVEMTLELYKISKDGYSAEVLPTVEKVTKQKPTTFKQFAEDNRDKFAAA